MTPQELLHFSAKAVGVDLSGFEYKEPYPQTEWMKATGISFFWGFERGIVGAPADTWNPMIKDDQAFWLMTEMEMDVEAGYGTGECVAILRTDDEIRRVSVPIVDDAHAAMREAITLCAATIGYGMV